jgi:hypothetical protein
MIGATTRFHTTSYNLDGDLCADAMLDQVDDRESPWRAVSGSAGATHQSALTSVVLSSVNIQNPLPVEDALLGWAAHVGAHRRP